jgi:hypothetical protein
LGVTGSSWWVPSPGKEGRPILSFLDEVIKQTKSLDDIVLGSVAQRVLTLLQPGYQEMQCDVLVAIAVFKDGKAAIGEQSIGSQTQLLENCARLHSTTPLQGFYDSDRCESLRDRRITNAEKLVETVRQLLCDGIAEEERTVEWKRRECGGKVDVVLVDKNGVRWV